MEKSDGLIQTGAYSIIGDRPSQQDSYCCTGDGNLLLASVCDGMGGMAGGERASQTAVRSLVNGIRNAIPLKENEIPATLRQCLEEADREVTQLCDASGNPLYAGTTAVAVMMVENRMYWGSVGDSRIYYLSGGEITTLTRMHNYNLKLDEMYRTGEISLEERERERGRGEALISFLGIGNLPLADVSAEPCVMKKGDMVLLCSDGLYKSLNDAQILAIVEESGENMQIAAGRLCNEALRLSVAKQDNTTVVILRMEQ